MKYIYKAAGRHTRPRVLDWKMGWVPILVIVGVLVLAMSFDWRSIGDLTLPQVGARIVVGFSLVLTIQGLVFLYWMLNAWNQDMEHDGFGKNELPSQKSFTAILPARHEEAVIGETITAIANIDYPEQLKELLVVIRHDDAGTIAAAQKAIYQNPEKNIRIVEVDRGPVNKPNQLNFGLAVARGEVVVVWDAEDAPHPEIYRKVNSAMTGQGANVVQAGVQLVNYKSRWFSALNCLEYYFWFKSILPWFAKRGVVSLGGNTVFFERTCLQLVGGWDKTCLTEDGDIGITLSAVGVKFAVCYSETYATREETPMTVEGFVRQRTRWNHGFLQMLAKGNWLKLPIWSQRILALYLLLLPEGLAVMFVLSPLLAVIGLWSEMSIVAAMVTFLPLGILAIQMMMSILGLFAFARAFHKEWPIFTAVKIIIVFMPYLGLLIFAAMRAGIRFATGNLTWEKTVHVNSHRMLQVALK